MQAAGDQQHDSDGESRAYKGMEPEAVGEPIDQRAERADAGADDGEGPAGAGDFAPRRRRGADQGQPRQEG